MKKIISLILCVASILNCTAYAAGGENPIIERFRVTGRNSVLVIMYHKLSEKPSEHNDFFISPSEFEKDICLLAEAGYTFCTASELAELKSDTKSGGKRVVITFDDGYESDFTFALPILEKYGAKATFFVFGAAVGNVGYMSKEQIYSLACSPNAEIGNHSYEIHSKSAAGIKALYASEKNDDFIVSDFTENRNFLEEITKKQITALSYPNGIYNARVDAKLRKAGNVITFSTEEKNEKIPVGTRVVGRVNRGVRTNIGNMISK